MVASTGHNSNEPSFKAQNSLERALPSLSLPFINTNQAWKYCCTVTATEHIHFLKLQGLVIKIWGSFNPKCISLPPSIFLCKYGAFLMFVERSVLFGCGLQS